MSRLTSLLLASMLTTGLAQAASFDCAKARAPDEKAICADAQLSKLDEELAAAFQNMIKLLGGGSAAKAFRADQTDWLKTRLRCADSKPCLADEMSSRKRWLSHPMHTVSGEYSNAHYTSLIWFDGDKVLLRLYKGARVDDNALMAMELRSRWLNAADKDARGEDTAAFTPLFLAPHRHLEGQCSALRFAFPTDGLVDASSNPGCPVFASKNQGSTLQHMDLRFKRPYYSSPRPVR